MTPALRRWAGGALALALGALPWGLDFLATPPAPTRLLQASIGATVDDDEARPVALPHSWAREADGGCVDCRTAWYGFELPRDTPPRDTQGLLLPRVGRNAALYLNGRLLGQGGRFADPAARLGPRPLWAEAPPALWDAGANRLYVLMKSDQPRAGLMPAPALAPADQLRTALAWRQGLGVTLPQVAAAAAGMAAVMMGVLGYYRRRESGFGSLALAAGAFAAWVFVQLVVEPPWPDAAWDALQAALTVGVAVAVARLHWRMAAPDGSRQARAWGAAFVLSPAAAALAVGLEPSGRVADTVDALALAALAVTAASGFGAGWRRSDLLRMAPWGMLALAAWHDGWAAWRDGLAAADALPALPLSMAVLLGATAWTLLLRFVQTLNAVELLNIDLEGLVAERTRELQAQFERVQELERRQTLAAERERLMRDMHDGVGGHLVTMLAMIEADRRCPGELCVVVRDALDDMRLMIDSLEPVDNDLNAVLAMFHDRLAPRLRGAGVTLHWDVDLLPPMPGLTPTRVLHVLRMLQEGVTNGLRHGRARTLWMSARYEEAAAPPRVCIGLRDDGGGFVPAEANGGRGLKNLRRRAAEIGAGLTIDSAPGQGATLAITLPLNPDLVAGIDGG